MLSNSLIAGALASAYLTILVLHLNPGFPLTGDGGGAAGAGHGRSPTASTSPRCSIVLDRRSAARCERSAVAGLAERAAVVVAVHDRGERRGAVIMWLNLSTFGTVLDAQVASHLTGGGADALRIGGGVPADRASRISERRGGGVSAVLLTAMMAISIAAPLAARGWNGESAPDRSIRRRRLIGSGQRAPGGARRADRPRRRDARHHLAGGGRRPSAELRPHPRRRRRASSRDAASDAGRDRCGRAAATGRTPSGNGIRASALYRVRDGGPALELPAGLLLLRRRSCGFGLVARGSARRTVAQAARSGAS